jgi:acyl phosphate:glycerol-3-phosphate acyltransferase
VTRCLIEVVGLVASYLLGSIPFGLLFARLKGVDIRKVGSGNIGATNVFRSVSKPLGVATFACDLLKGLVPALLFPWLAAQALRQPVFSEFGLLCGCAAIAGHNWPVFAGFKGGKGISTSAGVLFGVAPAAVGVGLLAWAILLVATRYVSVASVGAAIIVPASAWILYLNEGWILPAVLTLLGALAVWRHKSNIQRLIKGTEHRFSFQRRKTSPTDNTDRHR